MTFRFLANLGLLRQITMIVMPEARSDVSNMACTGMRLAD